MKKMHDSLLFVYGTLRPEATAMLPQGFRPVCPASAKGNLYTISWFPGAIFSKTGGDIVGHLLEILPNYDREKCLASLDRYEGYHPDADPETNLYNRIMVPVKRHDTGEEIFCWAYEFNQGVEEEWLISSGDFFDEESKDI